LKTDRETGSELSQQSNLLSNLYADLTLTRTTFWDISVREVKLQLCLWRSRDNAESPTAQQVSFHCTTLVTIALDVKLVIN
jgi:hypothetical protein